QRANIRHIGTPVAFVFPGPPCQSKLEQTLGFARRQLRCRRAPLMTAGGVELAAPTRDDLRAVDAGMPRQLREPFTDTCMNAVTWEVDELRRDRADEIFERQSLSQDFGVGAEPDKQVGNVDAEDQRGDIEQSPEHARSRGRPSVRVEIRILKRSEA